MSSESWSSHSRAQGASRPWVMMFLIEESRIFSEDKNGPLRPVSATQRMDEDDQIECSLRGFAVLPQLRLSISLPTYNFLCPIKGPPGGPP